MNKDNRVQVMMSDDELVALDEWRFANKIASRGEAVRRLIADGIAKRETKPEAEK